ncbi:hypothetical protein [Bradyrhizobium tunisiense]|uniref:hypothetical protein n=1 Tax=Bradyrhizobium tunisiense TaxID=3278709 RepID=UPI0035D5A81E
MTELVRYEAARRALAEAVAVDEVASIRSQAEALRYAARIAGDKQLEIQAAQIRFRAERKMGELLAAASEAGQLRRGRRWEGEDSNCSQSEQLESEDKVTRVTLQEAGIDRKLSSRAQKMAAMAPGAFEQALEKHAEEMRAGTGRVAMDLLKVDAEERGRIHRRDLAAALSSASAVASDGRLYPALLADPPWRRKAGIGDRAYENHYPTMPWPEILDYLKRAGEALLPDSWAWMWIPRAHLLAKVPFKTEVELADGEVVLATVDLPLAYACQLALGMDAYSTCYVWTKTDEAHPDVSGTGLLVWDQDELLLQFKRGRGLPKPASEEKFGSNHRERATDHSRKPEHYRQMIRAMVGCDSNGEPLPVLELFARVDAEHPLPQNWGAWGNQAGVSAQGVEISNPTGASDSSSPTGAASSDGGGEATATAERPAGTGDHPALHPSMGVTPAGHSLADEAERNRVRKEAIVGQHVVTNTREYPGDEILSVATCQCGWSFRADALSGGAQLRDVAVDAHWRDVIAKHETGVAAELPAGEAGAAAAEATDGASSAALASQDAMCNATGASESSAPARAAVADVDGAPYDAGDVVTIDQLAGSDWLVTIEAAAADATAEVQQLSLREQLKILSDFCHKRRDLAALIGPLHVEEGLSYVSNDQWQLRGKGWDRLRELEAAELPKDAEAPHVELTAPYEPPQRSFFDLARQVDDAPSAEVVDGALQTRLPVDADELAEQLALLDIAAGRWDAVEPDMIRHLVGARGFAHCTTTDRVLVTDDGRAFLAQLVMPSSAAEEVRT